MPRKDKKLQIRIRSDLHRQLMTMADQDRVSMAEWLAKRIKEEAKRRGLK
jgi:predicted HicB family RNase H-like nuclease